VGADHDAVTRHLRNALLLKCGVAFVSVRTIVGVVSCGLGSRQTHLGNTRLVHDLAAMVERRRWCSSSGNCDTQE
jgi:hypothetical protein